GNGARLLQQSRSGWCVWRKDEIGLQSNEFYCKSLHRLRVKRCPAGIDPDVAPLRPPEFLELLAERRDIGLSLQIAFAIRHQHADEPPPLALLRPRRQRPNTCSRAAEQADKIAPSHLGDPPTQGIGGT